jgi:hypothetical protein
VTAPLHTPGVGGGRHPGDDPAHVVSGRSLGDLMGHVAEDLSTLMRQEIQLAKAELRQEGSKAGKAAGLLTAAGVGGFLVLFFLSFALWGGLANVMDQGWAALIVAIIWGVIAAVLYRSGRSHLRQVNGLTQTTETMNRIPGALTPDREGVTR